ncbi:MAG: class I SAM-dependent DNA methyltransferase [Bacteroidetes bacterium]|nr:class I SAM-dependent DNA methyltransferase [Bacteroidota bacterium]MDE2670996.1 class I SAM-dependent DNA methyltransferase [Bacteroidota bacterium]
MALKKSQLYASLWQSCDELRGGMDASQYKDYVLTLLFMKYVSDKDAGHSNALIEVPQGGSFADIIELKGDKEIGDKINKIIGQLAETNDLKGVIDQADFNDESKLGSGKDMQDRLSRLVAIFEGLDFRANRAEGDDLLGDAYEYLMRHFATESGKSKGQFYTPAEVSRVMAQVVGIGASTRQDQTIYDPTCGSGSLLLKAAAEAPRGITIYGQERDNVTWALARMNMILHGYPTAELWRGNTLADPYFKNRDGTLKTFDFAVANPPFSDKAWTNGLIPEYDKYGRFKFGIPPLRNGDYAFLLHFIASVKSTGKGAIILPHGVLFRGNREAEIRRKLIQRGFIKGIIGLPSNLFYGTGIPACIVILDKEDAGERAGIFMIDASKRFLKDGSKNRLRARDIHQIVDVYKRKAEEPRFSRLVPIDEIANQTNYYNLNIRRYIDSRDPEDLHDLEAHLNGGIPDRDIDTLEEYWNTFPSLRRTLFKSSTRTGYSEISVDRKQVKASILGHEEFKSYVEGITAVFNVWCNAHYQLLIDLQGCDRPRIVIERLSEDLLICFQDLPLLSAYDIYQQLMDYWDEVMQDDVYLIAASDWQAGRTLRLTSNKEAPDFAIKKGNKTYKYVGELIPASLLITRFFGTELQELQRFEMEITELTQRKEDFEEENGSDDGALSGLEGKRGITKGNVQQRVIELKNIVLKSYPEGTTEHNQAKLITKTSFGIRDWPKNIRDEDGLFKELDTLYDYLRLINDEKAKKERHKQLQESLYEAVTSMYSELTEAEIKALVIKDKWFTCIWAAIEGEIKRLARQLTRRINELSERYASPLPQLDRSVADLAKKVEGHLKKMDFDWE